MQTRVCVCVCVCVYACALSHIRFFVMPQTVAQQFLQSMGFSRQEYWSGLPFPFLGGLPDPRIEPKSLVSPALAGRFFIIAATQKAHSKDTSTVTQYLPTLQGDVTTGLVTIYHPVIDPLHPFCPPETPFPLVITDLISESLSF